MRRPVRNVLVVVAAATVLGLTGCSQSPSTAVVVDGTVITEASVSSTADAISNFLTANHYQPLPSAQARVFAVRWLAQGVLADTASRATGVTISNADVMQAADQSQDASVRDLLDDPGLHDAMAGQIRWELLANKIPRARLDQALQDTVVTLNPRYGQWLPGSYSTFGEGLGLSAPILPATGS